MEKIKVAHVITRMIIGGAQENTLYTVCGLMKKDAYDVTLVTGPTYGPEGSLESDMDRAFVPVVRIPALRRNLNVLNDITAFCQLYVHFKHSKYDVVHTHSSKAGILGRLAATLAGVPIVVHTIHGLPFHAYERSLLNWVYIFLEKCAARWCAKIVTVCDEMITQAVAARIAPRDMFTTIYSGLDVESFLHVDPQCRERIRKQYLIPDDAVVIGKIGRLFDLKGHTYLLDAACSVVARHPETYFLCVGGGVLEKELKDKARSLGIEKHIIFTGLIPTREIPSHIHVMDFVTHVSLREGLPRVVPQAFLCEKAVVAFDIDGARDIICHGENGYLVTPKDTDELAMRLCELIDDPQTRKQFALAGKQKVLTVFPKEVMVDCIDRLYHELRAQAATI